MHDLYVTRVHVLSAASDIKSKSAISRHIACIHLLGHAGEVSGNRLEMRDHP
jgi:hypothetical protein